MSKYTISIRELCTYFTRPTIESWFKDYNLTDFLTNEQIEIINSTGVWNKDKLASMIVDHFYMKEIGYETPELFRIMVKSRLNELMGYYLPIIYTTSIKYDPLVNIDYTEDYDRDMENTGSSTNNANSSGLAVNSDTPQGQISKDEILKGKYASSTTASESTGTTRDDVTSNETEKGSRRRHGKDGTITTYQKMIKEYRDTIFNVNNEIIKELSSLFMGLW